MIAFSHMSGVGAWMSLRRLRTLFLGIIEAQNEIRQERDS